MAEEAKTTSKKGGNTALWVVAILGLAAGAAAVGMNVMDRMEVKKQGLDWITRAKKA
jgi:hypothetical protein